MGSRRRTPSVDGRIARIARRQHGLFTLDQALRAGASAAMVARRVRTGRWERVHRGVYRSAGAPATWTQAVLAACLAAGPGAAASHGTAMVLWGFEDAKTERIHISVPRERRVTVNGVTVHRPADLPEGCTRIGPVPVTKPDLTLVLFAAVAPVDLLEEGLDHLLRRRLVSIERLGRRLEESGTQGRRGAGVLRELLSERSSRGVSESTPETRILRLLRRAGEPLPKMQHVVRHAGGVVGRVDLAYVREKVFIEVDGYRYHSSRKAQDRDSGRQNRLVALGWTPVRVTPRMIDHQPEQVVRDVRAARLRARPTADPGGS